ncbi:unnamed protein product, partial [Pocillopora meandrina]
MTNSKIKSDSLKLVSLNVRGLSNFRKCGAIFTWCRKQKADLIFLQETHSTKAGGYKWKKEWGSEIIFSHGSLNARVRFYQNLSATLRKMDPRSDDNIVVGGDFNCPLNPTFDKKGGILIPRQHVINSIEN